MTKKELAAPLFGFQFEVRFRQEDFKGNAGSTVDLCSGSFSEITGLEATMQPKTIPEGGRNYGANQRVGSVDFSTVIMKRGMTKSRDAWRWFEFVNLKNNSAYRLSVLIQMFDANNQPVLTWRLVRAVPVKYKMADLVANRSNEIAIEELHLVHEGLELEQPK
jgi:phage tail-like protein